MAQLQVRFEWVTGLKRPIFRNVRLMGSWDEKGRYSSDWRAVAMQEFQASDGCPAWRAAVAFDAAQLGWTFHWGVIADSPQRTNVWAIPTEVADPNSRAQHCDFQLRSDGQIERYWFTHCRRLGANKFWREGAQDPAIRFSVWAPNAKSVAVALGDAKSGYIWSNGTGDRQAFALTKGEEGIWSNGPAADFSSFGEWDHKPYMYRIVRDDGSTAYRTDLYSRCQIGTGRKKPEHPDARFGDWNGTSQDLNGTQSCSVVIDPKRVTELLEEPTFPPRLWLADVDFWANEYDPLRPVPARLEELVIYELHVEGLLPQSADADARSRPGSFKDAIDILDHLVDLGVNAVELMPMSEAGGWSWGYGTSHYFATDYAGGGRDQFKHFVRECHRRGIAVLLDVVYNHYVPDAERAQYLYDATQPDRNVYYWYEGSPSDWPTADGGYLDNGSTGWAPNYRSEFVRKLFVSSAAMLLTEFHVDGFRVDLTQAFHRDNCIHANGEPCPRANLLGAKFLREWVRTLRLIKPSVILTAEDHTGWSAITQPQETGGIGFDAAWWADWYHNLIGDSQNDPSNARLVCTAGFGGNEPLAMSVMADKLLATPQRVIYNESHDQAGNATYQIGGRTMYSARTIQVAVNGFLDERTRPWAEARCRVACGFTLLTPGVPMFFMGEEVGAKEPYRYDDWLQHREDIQRLQTGSGAQLFCFYRDVIGLRRREEALISPHVDVLHVHDENRVLAFRRWLGDAEFLVLASLNNAPFDSGYQVTSGTLRDGAWIEVLNSDARIYGGDGICNSGVLTSGGASFNARLPANGIAVFQRL
ncbi:MAG: alpha-amylase family glycosyl hydrolase [Xanthobacteraceae bacterium]